MNGTFPTWIKIITQVGFPIAITIYFIVTLQPVIAETKIKLDQHIQAVADVIVKTDEQTRLLKAICRNTAGNDFEKANCDI